LTIIPMKRRYIKACEDIVAASEPWKTLREKVDFGHYISRGQAYACIRRGSKTVEVTGFIIFTAETVFARGGYLRAVGVAASLRGQGIGSMLLAFAERAVARQATYLYLCVSSFNRKGQAFYKKRGYTKVGTLPGLTSSDTSEYIYWKRLKKSCKKEIGSPSQRSHA
jgi:ribosomal protein S18 acetylase RimI-like enzyme